MRAPFRVALVALSLFSATAISSPPLLAQDKPAASPAAVPAFAHAGTLREALQYESQLKSSLKREGTVQSWRAAAAKAVTGQAKNYTEAARAFTQAVILDEKDASLWLALAKAHLAASSDKNDPKRFAVFAQAQSAAYLAYDRATTPEAKAQALSTLSDAYKLRSQWRPAIEAAKAGLGFQETPALKASYDALRNEHGFRMLDYKVENEASTPRLCLQFSEDLSKTQTDWSKFVSVDGKDAASLTAEERQICIDGVAHGKRYEITVRAGLPSAISSETLLKTAELGVYIRDRSPSVRAGANTYVLPSRGQAGVPLTTVNTERVAVEVYRIGDRSLAQPLLSGDLRKQMSPYEISKVRKSQGERVWKGEMPVKNALNEEVTTAFPVAEAIGALKPGVYLLAARPASGKPGDKTAEPAQASTNQNGDDEEDESDDNGSGKQATQWFIVSDLGLTAFSSEDGVHGFVRSLGSAEPAGDVEVRLVARNNEILATAKTDARGYVKFAAGLAKGEAGSAPTILVAERLGGGDYAFLDLTASAFDLTDRGVSGREPAHALEAQVFTERGVYKPGETVHVTALVRDATLQAPKPMPVTVVLSRPDGVEHRRLQLEDQGFGGRTVSLSLSSTVQTGTWRTRVYADPKAAPIGEVSFLVEDFVPERLDVTLAQPVGALDAANPGTVDLKGRYLYGPPAADLAVEGEVVVRPRTGDLDGFKGYRFGLADEQVTALRKPLDTLPRTDAKGDAKIAIELPQLPNTAKPLEAQIIARVREPGGRAVERSTVVPLDTKQPRVGIKPLFDAKSLGQGEPAAFEVVLVGADGKAVPEANLSWQLQRIDSRWQWFSRDGSWNYEVAKFTKRIADGKAEIRGGTPAKVNVTTEWGRYRLEVTRADTQSSDPIGSTASMTFDSGYWGGENIDTPEMLEVALDKPSYKAGDTAKLTIASQGAGRAMVAVLSRGLISTQEVEVSGRTTTVDVPVTDAWAPGAYVTALMYRPMDEKAKRMPSRSIGLKWAELDKASRTLGVTVSLPEKVPSASRLTVPIKLGGLAPGEPARLVVSAVDLGVLNVTRYEVPAPEKFFFSQRRLGTEIRDLYGRLIDGMRAEKGRIRTGGDAGSMAMSGSPQAEKPLALFSGMVIPGSDGTAKVEFDLPEFNGTVRVTAVAWSAGKVGSTKSDVIVRDPVALLVTAPRFLTMGDEARLNVDVHNVEGQAGAYKIAVGADFGANGTVDMMTREVQLGAGERKSEGMPLKADRLAKTTFVVRVTGPGGIDVGRRLALDVKPPGGDIRRSTISQLKAGAKLSLSPDLLADMIPDRAKVTLAVGPAAGFDVAGLLLSLDRYPHGCAEQTTSRAMPLVYLNEMAKLAGLKQDDAVKERVQKAIDRLWEMQESSGAFGIWGPRNGDLWLTAYVTDFLTRAKEAGYVVLGRPFGQALDKLANSVRSSSDFEKGGEDIAYALYVLARNGRAPVGELRYFADTKIEKFATALARTQIGAALGMLGDKERSERAFKSALSAFDGKNDSGYRADYGSTLRDGAAMLTLASEVGMARAETPRLATLIGKALSQRTYTSTQENAWMLLAARSMVDEGKRASLDVNGQPHTGALAKSYSADELRAGHVVITNKGDTDTTAVVTVTGDAATPEPAASKGFKIERSYFTLDGKPVAMASATGGTASLTQNTRLIAVVKVVPEEAKEGRIIVVDRLPAGLEIENPRLIEGASLKAMPWLQGVRTPEHAEFRDDRFVAALDLSRNGGRGGDDEESDNKAKSGDSLTFAYMIRAVSPGSYVHPAATVEDMYRPERFARTASGRLEVK